MSTNPKADAAPASNRDKEPEDWVTGDETMTGAQASYLKTLCEKAGEVFHEGVTKAEASSVLKSCRKRQAVVAITSATTLGLSAGAMR